MTEFELFGLIRQKCRCEIQFTRPDEPTINLNEHGQPNRLNPITPGRENYTITLDQDAIELLAAALQEVK